MDDIDRRLRQLREAEPDPRLASLGDAVMGRVALLPGSERDGDILRWGGLTAVAALVVGTTIGGLSDTGPSSAGTVMLVSAGLELAPSTLLASAR